MNTSKWRCLNRKCINFGITQETDNNVCSQCFFVMNEAYSFEGVQMGKFSSMSAVEQKACLKKRAQDHDMSKPVQDMINFKKRKSLGLNS